MLQATAPRAMRERANEGKASRACGPVESHAAIAAPSPHVVAKKIEEKSGYPMNIASALKRQKGQRCSGAS